MLGRISSPSDRRKFADTRVHTCCNPVADATRSATPVASRASNRLAFSRAADDPAVVTMSIPGGRTVIRKPAIAPANAHTTASISEPATAVVIASPDAVRSMQ